MSNHLRIYLAASRLPDAGWLASAVAAMARNLRLDTDLDPHTHAGVWPCSEGSASGGVEWHLSPIDEDAPVPPALAGRRVDSVVDLVWRSALGDARVAVLMAANLAHIAGGVLDDDAGRFIEADDALRWATETLRGLTPAKAKRAKALPDPVTHLSQVVSSLVGEPLAHLFRALPDDPLTGWRFGKDRVLSARCWTVVTAAGQMFRADGVAEDAVALTAALAAMQATVGSGPVQSASFDAVALTITLAFPGGRLTVRPPAVPPTDPRHLADRWSFRFLGKPSAEWFPDEGGIVRR